SVNFMRFIGVVETLGGLGMVLPGLLKIKTGLTPLAAAGLVIVMIGAVVVGYQTMGVKGGAVPLLTGIVAAVVGYGGWRLGPLPAGAAAGAVARGGVRGLLPRDALPDLPQPRLFELREMGGEAGGGGPPALGEPIFFWGRLSRRRWPYRCTGASPSGCSRPK